MIFPPQAGPLVPPANRSLRLDHPLIRPTFQQALAQRPIAPFQLVLVALLLLVLVIDGVDIQLLSLVAPVIIQEWAVQRADFGPALAGALIGMSGGALLGGWLGDRFGRLPVLLLATFSFGLATALAGLTDSVASMTWLRIFSGIGFGAAAPNAIALASEWLPERARSQITSLMSVGTPGGGMIGASLVLLILPVWGWRVAFYACGALTVALAALLLLVGRESPAFLATRGRASKASETARRCLGMDWEPVIPASQSAQAAPAGRFLTRGNLRLNIGSGLGFFAIAFVSYAFVAWTAVMLTGLGLPIDRAVVAVFCFNLAAVAVAVIAGFVMRHLGTRLVMAGASLLLCLAVCALALVLALGTAAGNAPAVYLLTGAAGGFAGAAMASIYAMMAAGYPVACRAAGLGFGMMLGRAGGIAASFAGGHLLDLGGSGAWAFLGTLAAAALVGAGCAFVSDKHVPGTIGAPRRSE